MTDTPFVPLTIVPSAEQLAVQLRRARYLLVEANAGATKTTTIALRIAQALHRGAPPKSILALTYTEPAVEALRKQLEFIGVTKDVVRQLHIQTFEAFSLTVLENAEGDKAVIEASRERVKPYVIRAIERAQTYPEERHPEELAVASTASELVEGLLKSFDVIKGRMLLEYLDEDQRMTPELAEDLGFDYFTMRVRSSYERARRGGHPDRPEFRSEGDGVYDLARKIGSGEIDLSDDVLRLDLTLVCIDEMHDLNRAAFNVLKAVMTANPRAVLVGVGDRDQVIHTQTGAEAAFMGQYFEQEIGLAEVLPLTSSRRFSQELAFHAGALAKKPYAADPACRTDIRLEHCDTPRLAAEYIARQAQAHLQQERLASLRVLLRHPSQSVLIEHELLKLGVAYGCAGFAPYLERPEILLVRGLYAFARNNFSGFDDRSSRGRLLEGLLQFSGAKIDSIEVRHMGETQAQRVAVREGSATVESTHAFIEAHVLRGATSEAKKRLLAAIKNLQSGDAEAFSSSFLLDLDPEGLAANVLVRKADIAQVRDNVRAFCRAAVAEDVGVDGAFRMFSEMDARRQRFRRSDRVVLSSIESSKGLEFDHVIIPGLSKGEFAGATNASEDRNLFYVAVTRTKSCLTLCFDPQRPSKFLKDARFID